MSITKITENVYSVGVINPSLRIFDIIMEAKYGTSYNAYLVTGEKNILIDTVHHDFFDEYIYNVQCLIDIESIDYLIVNHTELDHSGSISKLLEINPKIKIVCTVPASKYLKNIINKDFEFITVRDGDNLKVGQNELEFIVKPFLHWPDTMMTYVKSESVLFPCDFLGCHFCEPTAFDYNIKYKKEYLEQFKYYYDGIFGPFKPYVMDGINKLKDLKLSYVCPSHGPVLTDSINDRIDDYEKWSQPELDNKKNLLIIYASAYGCTKKLAEAAAEKVREDGKVDVEIIDVVTNPIDDVANKIAKASALLVGSCTINRDAPKVIWDVLSRIDAINTRKKVAGCFGSYGWSGEAVKLIKERLSGIGYKVIDGEVKANFMPNNDDLNYIKEYALKLISEIK